MSASSLGLKTALGISFETNKREALNALIDEFIEKALTEKTK